MEDLKEKLPLNLIEKIESQYGKNVSEKIIESYKIKKNVSLRINTLKTNKEDIISFFEKNDIEYKSVSWYEDAFILLNVIEEDIEKTDIYNDGKVYLQNLSSMLPPLILNPKEKCDILDMTAAPGGKTTQIAALTENKAYITACEMNKIRAERLRYNLNKQGANVYVIEKDARELDNFLKYDQILLDAPCSGSGTIVLSEKTENIRYTDIFAEKLEKVQTKLLNKAINLLKKNEEMVYSTCSILERENENIVNKFINANKVQVIPFDKERFKDIELLPCKLDGAMCVMPNENYEGFFAVKLRKK